MSSYTVLLIGDIMNFKHADLSLFAGERELVTLPGAYLDTLNFPFMYEDFKVITIVFGDTGMNADIIIEFKFFEHSPHVDFVVNGNNICYDRLFYFIDESLDEPITRAKFKDFQLIETLMLQEWLNGFVRKIPEKPVIRCYDNGDLKYLKFMPIDNIYTYTDYSGVSRWNKPYDLYFDDNQQINHRNSSIWFKDVNLDTQSDIMSISEYIDVLYRLTGHTVEWNEYTYQFEFYDYELTSLDEIIIDVYFFFDHYEKQFGSMFNDKNALLRATEDEKLLLHMLTV